jgi:hypothetical protein
VVKNLKKRARCREDHFPKILFVLSWCRIAEDNGFRDLLSRCRIAEDNCFGDLLSRSQMHVDEWDELASTAQQHKR